MFLKTFLLLFLNNNFLKLYFLNFLRSLSKSLTCDDATMTMWRRNFTSLSLLGDMLRRNGLSCCLGFKVSKIGKSWTFRQLVGERRWIRPAAADQSEHPQLGKMWCDWSSPWAALRPRRFNLSKVRWKFSNFPRILYMIAFQSCCCCPRNSQIGENSFRKKVDFQTAFFVKMSLSFHYSPSVNNLLYETLESWSYGNQNRKSFQNLLPNWNGVKRK